MAGKVGWMTRRNVSAGTAATGVPARKKSSTAYPAITTNTGVPSRKATKRASDAGHPNAAVTAKQGGSVRRGQEPVPAHRQDLGGDERHHGRAEQVGRDARAQGGR